MLFPLVHMLYFYCFNTIEFCEKKKIPKCKTFKPDLILLIAKQCFWEDYMKYYVWNIWHIARAQKMLISLFQSQFQYLILSKIFSTTWKSLCTSCNSCHCDYWSWDNRLYEFPEPKIIIGKSVHKLVQDSFFLKNGILFQPTTCFIESILNITSISY